jgi:hypothetical protein
MGRVSDDANPPGAAPADDPADLAAYASYSEALRAALVAAVPGWVDRCVDRSMARAGLEPTADVREETAAAGRRAAEEVDEQLGRLLATDIDAHATTPLELVRGAVRYPTEVLRSHGVPPVDRDDFRRERFADDLYDLAPATFADVDPALQDPGLAWGAAKAYLHLHRHGRH